MWDILICMACTIGQSTAGRWPDAQLTDIRCWIVNLRGIASVQYGRSAGPLTRKRLLTIGGIGKVTGCGANVSAGTLRSSIAAGRLICARIANTIRSIRIFCSACNLVGWFGGTETSLNAWSFCKTVFFVWNVFLAFYPLCIAITANQTVDALARCCRQWRGHVWRRDQQT